MPCQDSASPENAGNKNGGLVREAVQFGAGEVPHEFYLLQSVFGGRIAQVIEQLHAVNRAAWRMAVLAFGIITRYLILQLLPRNQFVHPFQKDLAAAFALLVLVRGFEEGDLIHGGTESYAVDDGRIIGDFEIIHGPPYVMLANEQTPENNKAAAEKTWKKF